MEHCSWTRRPILLALRCQPSKPLRVPRASDDRYGEGLQARMDEVRQVQGSLHASERDGGLEEPTTSREQRQSAQGEPVPLLPLSTCSAPPRRTFNSDLLKKTAIGTSTEPDESRLRTRSPSSCKQAHRSRPDKSGRIRSRAPDQTNRQAARQRIAIRLAERRRRVPVLLPGIALAHWRRP